MIWVNFIEPDQVIDEAVKGLTIPFNSRFFVLEKRDFNSYEISDIYQISQNSSKIYSRFGVWENGKLRTEYQGYFYSKRMDLRGQPIYIGRSTV